MYTSSFQVLTISHQTGLKRWQSSRKTCKSSPDASQLQVRESAPPAGTFLEPIYVLQRVGVFMCNDVVL